MNRYIFYTPRSTKLKGGILLSPCPSVCPSVRLSVCPSVDKIVSALYLVQYSPDPFHIYTSYQATSEGVLRVFWNFGKFFKFVTLTLSCFDLGSIMSWSVVWIIMGRRGYPQNVGILVLVFMMNTKPFVFQFTSGTLWLWSSLYYENNGWLFGFCAIGVEYSPPTGTRVG